MESVWEGSQFTAPSGAAPCMAIQLANVSSPAKVKSSVVCLLRLLHLAFPGHGPWKRECERKETGHSQVLCFSSGVSCNPNTQGFYICVEGTGLSVFRQNPRQGQDPPV